MNFKVLLVVAIVAVGMANAIAPALPALSVIIPLEYALLKLKAAAIAGLLYLGGGRYHQSFEVGYGGHGWRRRRDVSEIETVEVSADATVDDVLQYDQLGCGMRLVCELSATPQASLQEDEKLMLKLFGGDDKLPNPVKASRAKLSYSYAALLGHEARDVNACTRVYGRCPYSASQVMQTIRAAGQQ